MYEDILFERSCSPYTGLQVFVEFELSHSSLGCVSTMDYLLVRQSYHTALEFLIFVRKAAKFLLLLGHFEIWRVVSDLRHEHEEIRKVIRN